MNPKIVALVTLLASQMLCHDAGLRAESVKPNIIVIYTDDQGFGDVSALNPDAKFRTPNMDRLAEEGIVFTNAHSSDSVCTPSRYGLLTGRYCWRTKMKRHVLGAEAECLIADDRMTLASLLGQNGYDTAMVGKWHLGMDFPGTLGDRDWSQPVRDMPLDKGFDYFYGIPASLNYGILAWFEGRHAAVPPTLYSNKKPNPRYLDYRIKPPYDATPEQTEAKLKRAGFEIAPDFIDNQCLTRFTDKAIQWMSTKTEDVKQPKPFFLYLPYTSPHYPVCPLPAFHGQGECGAYGEFLIETDHHIGRILKFLETSGIDDNTMIVFTSDNGPEKRWKQSLEQHEHDSRGGFREGKRSVYEGGHRVPFIVRWPAGIKQSSRKWDGLVGQVDLLATFADLIGVDLPDTAGEDSQSFASVFSQGNASHERLPLINHGNDGRYSITEKNWKLVLAKAKRSSELYDLANDRSERTDVAPEHPEVVEQLTAKINEIVTRGRTTPGSIQSNDTGHWKDLTWLTPRQYEQMTSPTVSTFKVPVDDARPNVIFVLADDMGYGEIEALNPKRSKVPTPSLNQLAAEGCVFTDAHSSSSVCSPTRYTLLTGRYNWRTRLQKGVLTGGDEPLIAADRMTLGHLFQQQGYSTAIVGKWHLNFNYEIPPELESAPKPKKTAKRYPAPAPIGTRIPDGPLTRGFDTYYGFHHARMMSSIVRDDQIVEELDVVDILPALTREVVSYIDKQAAAAKSGKPFFLYFPMSSPHTPIVPAAAWAGKGKIGTYGDFVAQTDGSVGAITEALQRNGLSENTILIFSADNGTSKAAGIGNLNQKGHYPSGDLRGSKADLWDGGHRVPFIVRWPNRVPTGSQSDHLICLSDLMATFADLFAVELADHVAEDSVSFLPALFGKPVPNERTSIVHHSISGKFSIRQGDWKLLLAPGSGGWSAPNDAKAMQLGLPERQLYDLNADLGEQTNLIVEHPQRANDLLSLLKDMVRRGRSTPGEPQSNDAEIDLFKTSKKRARKEKSK